MDYLVAQDLIRSEHLDLVREGGLNGFKPFETTCGAATEPLIRLSPAEPLTLDDFAGYRELDRFDFDEAVADCHFGRYDGGRLFYMTAPGQRPVLFAKADGDPLVRSNVAADGRPDPSLLRFGLWMSFGIAHNPHSIAIHSSVIVHSAAPFSSWVSREPGRAPIRACGESTFPVRNCSTTTRRSCASSKACRPSSGRRGAGKHPVTATRATPSPHSCDWPRLRTTGSPDCRSSGRSARCSPRARRHSPTTHNCRTISATRSRQLIARVPVYQLECLPDADAARLSFETTIADR